MAGYKFDGKYLTSSGRRVGKVQGDYIIDSSSRRVGKVQGDYILDKSGRRLGSFDGKYLKDKSGRRIIDRNGIEKDIDGNGGVTLAALWLLFVR
ncbi:hypothetical protein AB2B38_008405 [Balneola sp. MJW-20]|uniref:hypothetical protein n=1 Tax=Gracilimonas aurantiaca TaxID=3234185 RepID=UPI0034675696